MTPTQASSPVPAPESQTPRRTQTERYLATGVLLLLLIGAFTVLQPFLTALMWAIILSYSLWPLQRRLIGRLKGRRTLAALITTLAVTLVLVVPFVVIGFSVADDARALTVAVRKWATQGLPEPPSWLKRIPVAGSRAESTWNTVSAEITNLTYRITQTPVVTNQFQVHIDESGVATTVPEPAPPPPTASRSVVVFGKLLGMARSFFVQAGRAIAGGALEVALSVFFAFFILRDGDAAARRLSTVVQRIAGDRGPRLLGVAGNTVRGVVYGLLGTALAQGLMAGTGFLIAGVPGAPLLGLLTFFLSVVPVGPPMIWVPASIWLFTQGRIGWGIFMLIWGMGVSSIDNVIKPWLISQGSAMPFILMFLGAIGGALAFGFIGVFLGPTLLAIAYRVLDEWSRPKAEEPAPPPAAAV